MIKDYIIKNKKNGVNPQILWTNLWKKKKLKNDIKFIVNQTKNSEEYGIVKNFIKILPKKSRIIDGGCGHGEWVILLNELGFITDGLDFSNVIITGLKKPSNGFLFFIKMGSSPSLDNIIYLYLVNS